MFWDKVWKVKNGICLNVQCLEKNVFQYYPVNPEKHHHVLMKKKNENIGRIKYQDKYENTFGIFK